MGEHLAARFGHGLLHCRPCGAGDALVALAMVVGANVEERVVVAVVPTYELAAVAHETEEAARITRVATAPLHLAQQPAARDDGVRLEQFERGVGIHFRTDDAFKILLSGQFVDDHNLLLVGQQAQASAESLVLVALPVEAHADGNVLQREGGIGAFGGKGKFAVDAAVPADGAGIHLHALCAAHLATLGRVGAV